MFAQYTPDGKSVADPNTPPFKQAYILDQSGLPIILLSAATNISTSGLITGLTANSIVPLNTPVQVYCFAQTGLTAGVYWAIFSSTTSCQLYTDFTCTTTLSGITSAAYSSGTSAVAVKTIVVPGNSLGANGKLVINTHATRNGSGTGTVNFGYSVNGTSLNVGGYLTTGNVVNYKRFNLVNRNSTQRQNYSNFLATDSGAGTSLPLSQTFDTTQSLTIGIIFQLANTADFGMLQDYTIEIFPSP